MKKNTMIALAFLVLSIAVLLIALAFSGTSSAATGEILRFFIV